MDIKKIIQAISNQEEIASSNQVQVVLDVVAAYFDVPIRLVSPRIKSRIDQLLDEEIAVLEEYKHYKEKVREGFSHIETSKFLDLLVQDNTKTDPLLSLASEFYLSRSSNNSSLSFRLELHKEWVLVKFLEDYLALNGNPQGSVEGAVEYMTEDFYVFTAHIEELDAYVLCGPFLKLDGKLKINNERPIEKIIKFVKPLFNDLRESYPSYGEYFKFGSEYFSSTVEIAKKQTALALKSLNVAFSINIDRSTPAYFTCNDQVVLGKRHWVFFAKSSIYLSLKLSDGTSKQTMKFFHDYEENEEAKSGQLIVQIRKDQVESIVFKASEKQEAKYLEYSYHKPTFLGSLSTLLRGGEHKESQLRIKDREEQNYVAISNQTERNINFISNKRILILQEYLNNNWKKYLADDDVLSNNICHWVNSILRGKAAFIYEYSYAQNKLTGYASSLDSSLKEVADAGLNSLHAMTRSHRSTRSIAYRCIYNENRQYVQYQSLGEVPVSIPKSEEYFWRIVNGAQASIAHTLTYNSRSLGVLELQGDEPYFFRHENLYKLRQFATFFGDYLYRSKANKWIQDIIYSASDDDHSQAYALQCESLTNLFLASGAGIWIRDSKIKGGYKLQGFYGSKKINELLTIEPDGNFFKLTDDKSEGANFLKRRSTAIDKSSFFIAKNYEPSELSQAYKKALKDEGFDHILLFAINGSEGEDSNPQALVTIHNKSQAHNDRYPEAWGRDVAHISQSVMSAISIMHSVHEEKKKRIELLTHDLRTTIGQLRASADQMIKKIDDSNSTLQNKLAFTRFAVMHDLTPLAADSIQQIAVLRTNDGKTDKEAFYYEIQRQRENHNGKSSKDKWISLNSAYNKAFETRSRIYGINFTRLLGNEARWHIRMSPIHLNKILINLIQNAQKYSSIGTTIESKIYKQENILIFEMKNRGKEMVETEWEVFDVFRYQFRGTNGMSTDGEGLGLWQVATIWGNYIF
jgi:signal transduction histidine kinase